MQALNTHAKVANVSGYGVFKVLTPAEIEEGAFPRERCLTWITQPDDLEGARCTAGAAALDAGLLPENWAGVSVTRFADAAIVAPGDVIRLVEGRSSVNVLFRRGANSNTLLATERCNSLCLMCSQPPRNVDDHWLAREAIEIIGLVDKSERQIGISGGEPTLLGDELVAIIYAAKRSLPSTELHILTNGRRFSDDALARQVCAVRHPKLTWGVPLYAPLAEVHDHVVQTAGAFEETLCGLYNLARHSGEIEIRIVLHRLTVPHLTELAYFIFRNLSFAAHVAFMGLEPMGFARRNRDLLWIDPADYQRELREAVHFLANRGIFTSVYNLPLCVVDRDLWPFARQSISDWKNKFAPACTGCVEMAKCSGFFASAGPGWISRAVRPIRVAAEEAQS